MTPRKTRLGETKAQPKRTTLADVAKLAGVSLVTASYALRNNPKISTATRKRVHRAVTKLSYVPDPEIAKLMQFLRRGRRVGQRSSICILSFDGQMKGDQNYYFRTLVATVEQCCMEQGYTVDHMAVSPGEISPKRLTQILRSRGIQGILVPPMRASIDCSAAASWEQFSIVAATNTAQNLNVTKVVPNHLQIGFLALDKILKEGVHRIGLVTESGDHERVGYAYWAAIAVYQQAGRSAQIPPIQFGSPTAFTRWLQNHRPDLILTTESRLAASLEAFAGNDGYPSRRLVLLNNPDDQSYDGIYHHPEIVGKIAVNLLVAQIQRGERGLAAHPNTTMVEGSWVSAIRSAAAARA